MADTNAPLILLEATFAAFDVNEVDILVNNAGLGQNTALSEITLEEYSRLTNVNIRAVIFMTQAVLPYLQKGGRIINLSSIYGLVGGFGLGWLIHSGNSIDMLMVSSLLRGGQGSRYEYDSIDRVGCR